LASALPSGLTDALPTLLPDRLTRALPGRLTGASPGRLIGIQPGASSGTRSGWRRLAVAPTYPVPGARVQLDHILGRGPLPAVVATTTRTTAISDHRALLVDLADPAAG
jgi:endonuclease/exonuclease/phosphatase family metal-dependent hydrolase